MQLVGVVERNGIVERVAGGIALGDGGREVGGRRVPENVPGKPAYLDLRGVRGGDHRAAQRVDRVLEQRQKRCTVVAGPRDDLVRIDVLSFRVGGHREGAVVALLQHPVKTCGVTVRDSEVNQPCAARRGAGHKPGRLATHG